jgi:hypothetical protein
MAHAIAVVVGTMIGLAIRYVILQSRANRPNQG